MRKGILKKRILEGQFRKGIAEGHFRKGIAEGHFRKGMKGTVHKLEFIHKQLGEPRVSLLVECRTVTEHTFAIILVTFSVQFQLNRSALSGKLSQV